MLNDRNILRKVKTEIDRMTRPFNIKIRKIENELRLMRTRVSKLTKEISKLKSPEKD